MSVQRIVDIGTFGRILLGSAGDNCPRPLESLHDAADAAACGTPPAATITFRRACVRLARGERNEQT
jgi:hypothetical protein